MREIVVSGTGSLILESFNRFSLFKTKPGFTSSVQSVRWKHASWQYDRLEHGPHRSVPWNRTCPAQQRYPLHHGWRNPWRYPISSVLQLSPQERRPTATRVLFVSTVLFLQMSHCRSKQMYYAAVSLRGHWASLSYRRYYEDLWSIQGYCAPSLRFKNRNTHCRDS